MHRQSTMEVHVFVAELEYPKVSAASSTASLGGGGGHLSAYKGSKQCALYALQNSSRRSEEAASYGETSGCPFTTRKRQPSGGARTVKLVSTHEECAVHQRPADVPSRRMRPRCAPRLTL